MKKLLLILALLAYAAVSCEKPEPTSVDEPETEQPAPVDTAADTCVIYVTGVGHTIAMLYHTSSSDIDFEASIKSIQRHFTITLKDGSLDTAIYTNVEKGDFFPSDSGSIVSHRDRFVGENIKYGDYTLVLWHVIGNYSWGSNHTSDNLWCLYHNVTFNQEHTYEHITCDTLPSSFDSFEQFTFTEF